MPDSLALAQAIHDFDAESKAEALAEIKQHGKLLAELADVYLDSPDDVTQAIGTCIVVALEEVLRGELRQRVEGN